MNAAERLMDPLARKRIAFLFIVTLVFCFVFYWLLSHAYIEITLANTANGEVQYTLTHQASGASKQFNGKATLKRLVSRGSYEITARQGDKAYFALVKTGGFLRTSPIKAALQSEKNRTYIGNNPLPCMSYSANVLVSFGCAGSFRNAQLHVPATAALPTYVSKINTNNYIAESSIDTAEGSFVLMQDTESDEGFRAPHALFRLDEKGIPHLAKALTNLDEKKVYTLKPYRGGFLAHDTDLRVAYYYKSISSQPEVINLNKQTRKDTAPYALAIHKDLITVASYKDIAGRTPDETKTARVTNEITVYGAGDARSYIFEKRPRFSSATACGTNKLCAILEEEQLEIYDIGGQEAHLISKVKGAVAIESLQDNNLLVIRDKDVLSLDVERSEGYFDYSLGDYTYCGHHTKQGSYILCLINTKQDKAALLIERSRPTPDSIDKKVAALLKLPEIKDISIYGQFIHISPELGEPIFIPSLKRKDYDPATKKRVNDAIDQKVKELGIDLNAYRLTNVLR